MNDLDRIENALATKRLGAAVFERCAQDLLTDLYPGLSPIPGGTDWGRDADIAGSGAAVPSRLLATSSRTLDGVRKNMLGGIRSMKEHGVRADRLVLANPANLRLLERQKLVTAARRAGMRLDPSDIFDRGFFASRLRRDGYWRKTLLGLPSGPITLSRVAADLAESPWSFLPLVAREEDLVAVQGTDDLILTGPPGVGKSRLAGELPDVAFVDKDAPFEQIASDLRWALPSTVILDNASGHETLLRRLLTLRQNEADLFSHRLVAVCWPDEVEGMQAVLPAARPVSLDLIERGPMDDLLQAMGITGQLARSEILDQAEGRPGWAVTLADLLLRSEDAESLLRGKALFGQVDRYLRRAGIQPEAIDVLAVVAALGGVSNRELPTLAQETDVTRSTAAEVLSAAAKSGLIDVQLRLESEFDRSVRFYAVRPPMLSAVLVAERAFDAPAPMVDLDGLSARWPDRLGDLAGAAIDAALLGATNARSQAEALLNAALASQAVGHAVKVELCTRFMRLDERASEHVLTLARQTFDDVVAGADTNGWMVEPIVKLAAQAARWYQVDAAFELLLDACLVDERPTNPNPGHPLRQLDDLVHDFHPEIPRQEDVRYKLAAAAKGWLDEAPDDPSRQAVVTDVFQTLLSLNLRARQPDPGQPLTFRLTETVVPPGEMRRVFRELWPTVAEMLERNHPDLAEALIDVAADWLHIGGGHDHPFGQSHHPDSVAAAKEIGEALVTQLAARTDLSLGTRVHLRSTAEWHGVAVAVDVPPTLEVFFREIDRSAADWWEAQEALIADLKQTGTAWAADDPTATMQRLADLKGEVQRAKLLWPDRTGIVCFGLADNVADPIAWLAAAEAVGFMPEGCGFAEQALNRGDLSEEEARRLVAEPRSRLEMLGMLLVASPSAPAWAPQLAVGMLTASDFGLIETLVIREQLAAGNIKLLLEETTGLVQAMVAVALFAGRHREAAWGPGDFESAWLDGLLNLRPAALPEAPGYEIAELFSYLAQQYPATLAEIVERSLSEADKGQMLRALPRKCWLLLYLLPASDKRRLWHRFHDEPVAKWLLNRHLVGADIEWLTEMLDSGEMSTDEALGAFSGSGPPEPPLDTLAKVLVPRGVEPEDVAGLRYAGFWRGDRSTRYQSIVSSFEELAEDEDPNVKAVAAAGIRIFISARDEAAADERQQRIRGER